MVPPFVALVAKVKEMLDGLVTILFVSKLPIFMVLGLSENDNAGATPVETVAEGPYAEAVNLPWIAFALNQ